MPYLDDIVLAVNSGYFVSTGCQIQSLSDAGVGDDSITAVYVNAGTAIVATTPVAVTAQIVPVASPTIPRIDLVGVDVNGNVVDLAGDDL